MTRGEGIVQFTLKVLQCFIILTFFGIVLPVILDYMIFYISKGNVNFHNSVFVYKSLRSKNVIRHFIHVFRQFIVY